MDDELSEEGERVGNEGTGDERYRWLMIIYALSRLFHSRLMVSYAFRIFLCCSYKSFSVKTIEIWFYSRLFRKTFSGYFLFG